MTVADGEGDQARRSGRRPHEVGPVRAGLFPQSPASQLLPIAPREFDAASNSEERITRPK